MKKILYIIAALTAGASLLQAQNTTKRTMKTKLLFVASILLIVCGCKKAKQCEHVSPYAPFELSWTDYNSLDSVREYFNCHDSTISQHYNDTVMVKGYFVKKGEWIRYFRNSLTDNDTLKWVPLTGGVPKDVDTNRMAKVRFRVNCDIPPQFPGQPWWECCKRHLDLFFISRQLIEYEETEL